MAVWSFTSDCSLIAAKYQCEFVDIVLMLFVLYYLKKRRSIEPASFPFSFLPDSFETGFNCNCFYIRYWATINLFCTASVDCLILCLIFGVWNRQIGETESSVRDVMVQEVMAVEPVAFKSVVVDIDTIKVHSKFPFSLIPTIADKFSIKMNDFY